MKVSAGCDSCYAETLMDKRYHRVEWGQRKVGDIKASVGTRVLTAAANRRKPYVWQDRAWKFMADHGRRQRVFCSSLSDVFDNQVPRQWRTDLWKTIWDTPGLDWLFLTKRPENIYDMLPESWVSHRKEWAHVWLGTTCEDQSAYDKRWPILRQIPATVRFISYEPAIGPLRILGEDPHSVMPDWLICGGESGRGYREMPLAWANDIGWICKANGIPFFFKQISAVKPRDEDIPPGMMVREFPVAA